MEQSIRWEDVEVLIVGSGVMGASLAQAYAQNGVNVGLIGRRAESLGRARGFIHSEIEQALGKGIFSKPLAEETKNRILTGLDLELACRAGKYLRLVIESATEDMAVKKEIFQKLGEFCLPSVVLSSNTSCLDAEILASASRQPGRFVWMHFFFPAHKNHAAEYASTAGSSEDALRMAAHYMGRARKSAFRLFRYRKGGAANVILVALLLETVRLLDEGFEAQTIDEAGRAAFSVPVGFIELLERVGPGLAASCIASFSETSHPDDSFHRAYGNFFLPPESFKGVLSGPGNRGGQIAGLRRAAAAEGAAPRDIGAVDLLKRRFLAVAFMTSTEVVEAGLIGLDDADRLCRNAFAWPDGPFGLMNKVGTGEALRMVTEKMELSHRREINFPVPRLLIEQAQRNELWPLRPPVS
jgi:enoyl-CoA hydratase/3-hydroxyacyl-CoA dehydrogenase